MRIEEFLQARRRLERELGELCDMANKVDNSHMNQLQIAGCPLKTSRWSPSADLISKIVDEIRKKIATVEQELKAHDAKVTIKD